MPGPGLSKSSIPSLGSKEAGECYLEVIKRLSDMSLVLKSDYRVLLISQRAGLHKGNPHTGLS